MGLVRLRQGVEFSQRAGEPPTDRQTKGLKICTDDIVSSVVKGSCQRQPLGHTHAGDENGFRAKTRGAPDPSTAGIVKDQGIKDVADDENCGGQRQEGQADQDEGEAS